MKSNPKTSLGLGNAIKNLRKERGLTLQDLSDKTGLSTGFISKIERGVSQPSINNLQKICYALDVTLNDLAVPEFTSDPDIQEAVSRKEDGLLLKKDQRSLIYNLNNVVKLESIYSLGSDYKLDAMTLTGARAEYMSSKHRYDELGIVSKGRVLICFGSGEEYIMDEGDTLFIPAGTEHTVRKLSKEECISFWFKLNCAQED